MGLFGGSSSKQPDNRIGNLQVQQTGYNVTIPVVIGTNRVSPTLVYYTDFKAVAHKSGGGKGLGGGGAGKSYTYRATYILLCCEGGPQDMEYGKLWVDRKRFDAPTDNGMVTRGGGTSQTRLPYLLTFHPDDALLFKNYAYLFAANHLLSNSASIGNHSVEVKGYFRDTVDASVKDCFRGVLLNTQWGLGWDSSKIDALAQLDSYCAAYGIVISPALTEQKPVSEVLAQFAQIANSAILWSDGTLKCLPYSDTNHNGYVATPTTGIHLTTDDFIVEGEEDPVRNIRKSKSETSNKVTLEFVSRAHNYDVRPAVEVDQGDIEDNGLRDLPAITAHEICLASVAHTVSKNILQRALYISISYEFSVSWVHCLLEPMDVVFLTDESSGLVDVPVRITRIVDRRDGLRTITAEEMPFGVSHSESSSFSTLEHGIPFTNIGVGSINAPVIFMAPSALADGGFEIWVAVSNSDSNYGGCIVHSSFDDATYKRQATVYGNSIYGVLTADLVAGTDPDFNPAHELKVNLSISAGTLVSLAADDAQLCLAGDEFVAFRFATLTGLNQYDLFSPVLPATVPFLRRGLYGSTQGSASGDRFVVCDQELYRHKITAEDVGKTIYFKFQSFNVYNDGLEDLDTVTAYSLVITAPLTTGSNLQQWD